MSSLDAIAIRWQEALDAGSRGVEAGASILTPAEASDCRRALAEQRHGTSAALAQLARMLGLSSPWLSGRPVTRQMLGLEANVRACIFDLDGVLTDSGALHAAAWAETLGPFLESLGQTTPWTPVPFDAGTDYDLYFDGRTRVDGIRLFLESRGLHAAESAVQAIARRKGEVIAKRLALRDVAALAGARRFLEAAAYAHLGRAVVSASTTASPMLEVAELDHLVRVRIDAATIRSEHLRPRPAPDLLLAACAELAVAPGEAVSLTHSGPGVVACRSAGMHAIGVASGADAARLRDYGADRVVPSLSALLAPELRTAA